MVQENSPGHSGTADRGQQRLFTADSGTLAANRDTNPTEIPQATPVATLQPTPTVQPTPTQDLPPALVETNPLPLTEIGPKTAFTFYFNQPMERGSVQDALQADPAVAGSFQWMNDATVKFIPDKPLPVNTHLDVSFSTPPGQPTVWRFLPR